MGRLTRLALGGAALVLGSALVPAVGAATAPVGTPTSVSFVSSRDGWALAARACGSDTCVSLARTTDAGAAWSPVGLPSGARRLATRYANEFPGTLDVYFADASDGWVYGWTPVATAEEAVPRLWATHDGGATWRAVDLARIGVQTQLVAVAASDGRAYLIGGRRSGRFGVWTSPTGSDAWRRVPGVAMYPAAGGGEMTGALILSGRVGWALVGNDRGVTGFERLTAGGAWSATADPCHAVGDSYAVPTAFGPTTLADVCTIGGFGSYAAHPPRGATVGSQWLYVSHDGGVRFSPVRGLDLAGYSGYLTTAPGLPAFFSPSTILLASDITHGSSSAPVLIESRDGGAHWTTVYRGRGGQSFAQVDLVSARDGYALVRSSSGSFLLATVDGGRHWGRRAL